MNMSRTRTVIFLLLLALAAGGARAIDPMPYRNAGEERRFTALLAELRCLVCQNQSLADSDAALARDLRAEVFELMRDGKSDSEIRDFLVSRYGDFVLYRPPVRGATLALWFGPMLVLAGGALLLITTIRRRSLALGRARTLANSGSTDALVSPVAEPASTGDPN